jgi:hypothetical protein
VGGARFGAHTGLKSDIAPNPNANIGNNNLLLSSRPGEGEGSKPMSSQSQLGAAALDTLRGARGLPPAEAAAKLCDFLDSISTSIPDSGRLVDASDALRTLVSKLETRGSATNDDWKHALETMLSFTNDVS